MSLEGRGDAGRVEELNGVGRKGKAVGKSGKELKWQAERWMDVEECEVKMKERKICGYVDWWYIKDEGE